MRNLRINKQTITYINPTGVVTDEVNADGLKTGRKIPAYTEEAQLDVNIRIDRGGVWLRDYGISTEFDGIIETSDMNCPLDEGSIVTDRGKKFMLSRMDRSLNGLKYYLEEVK